MASPSIHMPRSRFDLSYSYKTAFNLGQAIPFYVQEVYPGDSFKLNSSYVIRTAAPFYRVPMDNLMVDCHYFFTPNRLTYDRWSEVLGENSDDAWAPVDPPKVPTVKLQKKDAKNYCPIGSIANLLGIPGGEWVEDSVTFNALPFRANALIYNEYFRNEAIQVPVYVNTGDNPVSGGVEQIPEINDDAWAPDNIYGMPFIANKYKDYFTACLPEPQKGDAVDIHFNAGAVAPVVPGTRWSEEYLEEHNTSINFWNQSDCNYFADDESFTLGIYNNNMSAVSDAYTGDNIASFANLGADLNGLSIANVNDLRYAFALQRMLEKDARVGTRYREYLYGHFGVISPDSRVQVPEYLGGVVRMPLNITQVTSTQNSSGASYQGQVASFSVSSGFAGFNKGFVEHGFVLGYFIVRQKHTYQQALDKFWLRKGRYDFYDPSFAYIGEQPVYNVEICGNNSGNPLSPFGYNEAYADLRFRHSKVVGALSTNANNGLDIWHFADFYDGDPYLVSDFVEETNVYLDRTLSAASTIIPNFILDAFHNCTAIRVLPTYGVPGLIDHA